MPEPARKITYGSTTHTESSNRKACDICKRRKVRCSGTTPCQNCVRNGVVCQYSVPHGRLAQTERRISLLQTRLRTLEAAWKQFLPNVDLPTAMNVVENQQLRDPSQAHRKPEAQENASDPSAFVQVPEKFQDLLAGAPINVSPPDSEYEDADTLDWDESVDARTTTDGIGSLSTKWKGIGYMGPQTGNTLLRKLQSISVLYLSPEDDLSAQQSPQTELPDYILKSSQFENQCIDWYFKYFHCAYPILHEGYFRAQLMGALPKPKDGSWPILSNIVRAIGAFSGDACNQNADVHFYNEAGKLLTWDTVQKGTMSLVQAFALLAIYLQKRNKPNSAFTLLGIAMNMAQGVGLHREFLGPAVNTFTMEIRRRVWWTLYIFDSAFRLTFGRPTLSLGGINTQLPRNLNDSDLAVDLDELPSPRDVPTVTSSLIWQAKLARIGNMANEKLVAKHIPDQSKMLALGEQVVQWKTSLPHYMHADYDIPGFESFTVPRMVLIWRSMHLRIIIHRPFLLDNVRRRKSLNFEDPVAPASCCFFAAEECIVSLLDFFGKPIHLHGSLTWYACYWMVTAVFVYVTCLLYEPLHESALEWRQKISDSRSTLERMGTFEPTALRAAQILDKVISLVPTTPDSTVFALNEPIRMEFAEIWNQSWADMIVPQEPSPDSWLSEMPIGRLDGMNP